MKRPLICTHSDINTQFYIGKVKTAFCGINLYLMKEILY